MSHELIMVLDLGGQNNQLVGRRIRDCGVYCEVQPYNINIGEIKARNPLGIIFTGGFFDANDPSAPVVNEEIFNLDIPVLALGYGAQMMTKVLGGSAVSAQKAVYAKSPASLDNQSKLFEGLGKDTTVWSVSGNYLDNIPAGFKVSATLSDNKNVAIENLDKKLYGLDFHPEIEHTENGTKMINNFLYNVCGCAGDWSMKEYGETAIRQIREQVKDGKVLLALSGGVDSSVLAKLLSKAIGSQLSCIFVDHGLMRKNEGDEVELAFKDANVNFIRVDAQERFLSRLKGITDPEEKRKTIGEEFIRVFEEEAKKIGEVDFLAQGTIYPDIIESGIGDGEVIKSHHNVGGLPDNIDFKDLIEPLDLLFKDEVRQLGRELGLEDYLVNRQPFPGPGLGVRVIGEITKAKLDILREADYIFRAEIAAAELDDKINQYFAVITNMRSVGVTGDSRTYDYTLALRGITTVDFMTAEFARIPYEVLDKISRRIVNEVDHINRVVYDITSKPPATIEWE